MMITRKIDGDTFKIREVDGYILVNKNDQKALILSPRQAKKIGSALVVEGAIHEWKLK